MKLKYEMNIVDIGGDVMALPIGSKDDFHGLLRLNSSAAEIVKLLETEMTEDELVSALEKKYDATPEQLRDSARKVIGILRENKLLCE